MVTRQTLIRFLLPLLTVWGLLAFALAGWPALAAGQFSPARYIIVVAALPLMLGLALGLTWWQRRTSADGPVMIVLPRRDARTIPPGQISFWSQIADVLPHGSHVAFEFSGDSEKQVFSMRAAERNSRAVMVQILATWDGAQIRPVDGEREMDPMAVDEGATWWVELRPRTQRPIQASSPDPLIAVMTDVARLPVALQGGVQVLVRADPYSRRRLGAEAAQRTATSKGKSLAEKRDDKSLDARASQIFLEAQVRVWASAPSLEAARQTARGLARTLLAQFGPSNPLVIARQGAGHQALVERRFDLFAGWPWTDVELSLIAHLTGKEGLGAAPQLRTASARALPPSPAVRVPRQAQTIVPLGA